MIIYCLHMYMCASRTILHYPMHYITFIYTVDMLKTWPLLVVTFDLIGEFIIVHAQYLQHELF